MPARLTRRPCHDSDVDSDVDEACYGPFLDEQFFCYDDKSTITLDSLEIYHTVDGFIGFNELEMIYNKGKEGNFDDVFFSGIVNLSKTDCLCEMGYQSLLEAVRNEDVTVTHEKLKKLCSDGKIQIELHCQLKVMPVCYLTTKLPGLVVIYSKNMNNLNEQRRYVVSTIHTNCFRRSEHTLQRYMLLKFVEDAYSRYRSDVLRENRDVHWLVKVYMKDYNELFGRTRPRLHRSEVYDYFAVHSEWLFKIFYQKKDWIDRDKWADWQETVEVSKKKAKKAKNKWGGPIVRPTVTQNPRIRPIVYRSLHGDVYVPPDYDLEPDSDGPEPPFSEGESSDDDERYACDPGLQIPTNPGLFNPMPEPTWYWTCNIAPGCSFVIDLGYQRDMEAPSMAPLTAEEKAYLRGSTWKGLYDCRLRKIWSKICQAHMDWHWREARIVVDHENKRIYALADENRKVVSEKKEDW